LSLEIERKQRLEMEEIEIFSFDIKMEEPM